MKKIICLLIFSLLVIVGKSQDTLFIKKENKTETVFCKITKITSMTIFYTENKIGKSISSKDVIKISRANNITTANKSILESKTLSSQVVKSKQDSTYKIQNLTTKTSAKKGKGWFVLSGLAIVTSGACSIISANIKSPTKPTASQLEDYYKQQKNLQTIKGVSGVIAGGSLIIGVVIHFK